MDVWRGVPINVGMTRQLGFKIQVQMLSSNSSKSIEIHQSNVKKEFCELHFKKGV
ncbi:hypothetical protein MTsPCn5_04940 [Croceitalea sp. MTPC5]|nr:hypothetical protein MTsPCn5_04940 [Croceitalea sp. MTPC5]